MEDNVFENVEHIEFDTVRSKELRTIQLSLPKYTRGFVVSDFDEFIRDHVGAANVIEFKMLFRDNEWEMDISSKEIREKLIRMGKIKIKNKTCWIHPKICAEIRGFIHWLPNSIPNQRIIDFLCAYGEVLFVENETHNDRVAKDVRYFGLVLKTPHQKLDVPHFHEIDNFLCWIILQGREPACFHCRQIGHRKSDCPLYKEKLASYCSRTANTAPERKKPRGRRHIPEGAGDEIEKVDHFDQSSSLYTIWKSLELNTNKLLEKTCSNLERSFENKFQLIQDRHANNAVLSKDRKPKSESLTIPNVEELMVSEKHQLKLSEMEKDSYTSGDGKTSLYSKDHEFRKKIQNCQSL
ncbi:CCHC-type domain-containing protein [Caerostris darwini]|uniref:CCHC-type domain-containing protein n=1 Tax=Caerostris darwini TaxID=1538125 RepID=A0AAV4WB57_9ARAC|nr:CCHC-type domain-containing protein [Caerostris darwini]